MVLFLYHMAKKKKQKSNSNQKLSPKAYLISGRARKLPVYECLVYSNWEELGQTPVIIARQHVNGNITFANFLVDMYCVGVKNAFWQVNITEDEYQDIITRYNPPDQELLRIEYNLAHNMIYEALDYAAEFHIDPHPYFKLAEMLLAEDDDSIPLIEIPLGKDGKPFLITNPDDDRASYYFRQLEKYAGPGNYHYMNAVGPFPGDDEDHDDENYPVFGAGDAFKDMSREDWEKYIMEKDLDNLSADDPKLLYLYIRLLMANEEHKAMMNKLVDDSLYIDHGAQSEVYDLPEALIEHEDYLFKILEGDDYSEESMKKVESWIEKYPDSNFLKSVINALYLVNDRAELALKKTKEDYQRYPDNVVPFLNYSQVLLERKQYKDFEELLNGKFYISERFPHQEGFSVDDFFGFYLHLCEYYFYSQQLLPAFLCRMIIKMFQLDSTITKRSVFNVIDDTMVEIWKEIFKKFRSNQEDRNNLIDWLMIYDVNLINNIEEDN